MSVDFSLFFFADSGATGGDGYRLLLESARFADANRLSAVWTPERHFHSFGGLYPNPAVTGAAVAAVTERVGIRAGSVVAPLHHPARIAEEWSVVDNLSGGRVGVSFASGWHTVDFVLRPENYLDRRNAMVDAVDTVRRLWRGEEAEFADGTGEKQAVRIFPPPVQPELPVWITSAGSPETCRMAGRLGAGLLTHLLGQDLATLERNIATYRDQVREPFCRYLRSSIDLVVKAASGLLPAGLDPNRLPDRDKEFLITHAFDRYFTASGLFGTVADGVETVNRLRGIGVDEIACLIDFGVPHDQVLRSLEYIAELRGRCQQGS
jgi:alkanesulfonate monooxygenase SsuD/methylene tetrahydromethanopterin reductase-like flavin-dependent oxidoreductase (luciferase family)